MRRRLFVSASVLAAVGAPVVAACSRSSNKAAGTASSGSPTGTQPGFKALDGHVSGHRLTVEVSPLVRIDDSTTALSMVLSRAADDANGSDFSFGTVMGYINFAGDWRYGVTSTRLIDTAKGRAWTSVSTMSKERLDIKPGQSVTTYVAFGAVDSDSVTVLVPQTGFVTVDVISRDEVSRTGIDLKAMETAVKDDKPVTEQAAASPIEINSRTVDGSLGARTGGKDVTIVMASDVTFAQDSADLAAAAEAQLQTVAGQIAQYPDGGTLTIVGHTDDVQDDAYNQALSEKRANAVKTRLGQLTGLDKWNPSVAGKGESEPRVSGTTDEARAANRRVEITLTPTGGTGSSTKRGGLGNGAGSATPSAQASSGGASLPEAKGPVGKGTEGVTVKRSDGSGQLTISLDHVTRAGGYLLGEVKVVAVDGDTSASDWFHDIDSGGIFSNSRNEDSASVQYTLSSACDGLAVVAGGMQILPADYVPGGKDTHWPLADFNLAEKLQAGTAMTVAVVWPDPGGDTITVDHQSIKKGNGSYAYRLTDIPVKDS
jgi:ompA/motB domain protein